MKQGDIYYIDWEPSRGHEFQKKRPGVILSSESALRRESLVTVVPFTSNLANQGASDLVVFADQKNRLWKDSVLKVAYITSFDTERFQKKIGVLAPEYVDHIKQYLSLHFAL